MELFSSSAVSNGRQVDPRHCRIAVELPEHGRDGVIASGFLRPERRDDQEARGGGVRHQVLEEGARRRIRPVDVLELEGEWLAEDARSSTPTRRSNSRVWAIGPDRRPYACASPASRSSGITRASVERSDPTSPEHADRSSCRNRCAQRLDDRDVGGATLAEVEACTKRHSNASIPSALVPRRQQPSLAHPGVAADQDRRRRSTCRRLERFVERGQLVSTTDEDGTGDADHAPIIGLRYRIAAAKARTVVDAPSVSCVPLKK